MDASAQPINESPVVVRSWFSVFCDLVKVRLTSLVLLTTLVGFFLGWQGPMDYALMLNAILGTGLVAAGASAFNQLLERDHDALMRRTENRPLPSGRVQPATVLLLGGVLTVWGLVWLAMTVNWLTSILGAATWACYVWVYTPLKRVTTLNTTVGAIPGALPPLMGWTAACGEISVGGWALFAILFFWQLPHFLAIAWMYRDDYARAGFVMLPVVDRDGERTGQQAVSHTLGLLPISLCPSVFNLTGPVYFVGAFLLGCWFLWFAIQFSRDLTQRRAQRLFFVSIAYLPLLLGLMVMDKIK